MIIPYESLRVDWWYENELCNWVTFFPLCAAPEKEASPQHLKLQMCSGHNTCASE